MGSIYNSTATSSTTSASTIRGYGGLASGLDTDTLIENMTYATRAKIAKQKQNLQSLEWEQEGVQSISSKLVELSQSYTSYTSSTNLSSSKFWARSSITTTGTYSSYVSATGTSSSVDLVSIAGVKQLAKAATMSSNSTVSDGKLTTGDITIIDDSGSVSEAQVSKLEGNSLKIQYGSTSYTVSLGSGTTSDGYTYDYSTGDGAVEAITKGLQKVSIGSGKTLADVIEVTSSSTGTEDYEYSLNMVSTDTAGNTISIVGGTQEALEALGIVEADGDIDDAASADTTITSTGFSSDVLSRQEENGLFDSETFAERVGGKNIKFTYNGTTSTLTFMTQSELESAFSSLSSNEDALQVVADDLQDKLDTAFGVGRISVAVSDNQLTFTTTVPSTGAEDTSSILSITSGSTGVIGKTGAMNVEYGESNRLNLSATLADSGLTGITDALSTRNTETTYFTGAYLAQTAIESLGSSVTDSLSFDELKALIKSNDSTLTDTQISKINQAIDYFDEGANSITELTTAIDSYVSDREIDLTINGEKIEGVSYTSTLTEIISAINNSDAKVTASYLSTSDKFSIVSTDGGEAGGVVITGDDADMLFGTADEDYTVTAGQDAIIAVTYEGSDEVTELRRSTNSFDLDGLTVSITGTFGYEYVSDSSGDYVLTDSGSYEKIADTAKRYTKDDDGNYSVADGGLYVLTESGDYYLASNGLYSYTAENNTDTVSFDATVDSEKIVDAVSSLIDALNEIIEEVNEQVSTKPDRDYSPLTDDQEEEMTDEQIEAWNEAAKEGILFADSDLRTLADSLRSLLSQDYDSKNLLETYGISVSEEYSDNGKLVFDEDTFTAALESNADDIKELFTASEDTTTGYSGGLMARIKTITEKYAATSGSTKGILIERAGSSYAPTSVLDNQIQNEMDDIEDFIDRLEDKLDTEVDRYIDKFTNLETLISQMNSQSSWLSSSTSS